MINETNRLKSNRSNSAAFTLAEVLIVLGIIGIIANMTIPTLMQNVKEQATIGMLKETLATFSSAYISSVQENGPSTQWDIDSSVKLFNYFAPYLKMIKKCDTGTGCFADVTFKYLNGSDDRNFDTLGSVSKALLANGSSVYMYSYGNCTTYALNPNLYSCGALGVDTNGGKGPNTLGIDYFEFEIATTTILPIGIANDLSATGNFNDHCRDKSVADGYGCTGWVIYNGNMDYLKCNDLSWTGKTTCN